MAAQQEQGKADDVKCPSQHAAEELQRDDFSGSRGRLGKGPKLCSFRGGAWFGHGVTGLGRERDPLCFIQPQRETLAAMESRVM